ncbi:MAG: polyprenol monophosphomannose synthase [Planctomycetia bacterium]|nr:polyprenol monophosphomannose synthase [Planctomycetia bacterium]
MTKILIALATYNERDNLPDLLDAISRVLPQADLLVVDDHSPDGTGDYVLQRARQDSRLHLLARSGKLGLGTAVVDALLFGLTHDYDYIVNMDADGSHPAEFLPALLDAALGADEPDVVIGSRYVSGGKIVGWPLRRRLASRAMNLFSRFVLRLNTRDNTGAFRCYRSATLRKLDFSQFRSRGYSFFEEMLFRLRKKGARFVEVPITFVDRVHGHSKVTLREIVRTLWQILMLRL